MSLFTRAVLASTRNRMVSKVITGTAPGRYLASRFVAGDDLDGAIPAAQGLNRDGLSVSLDLLGEEVHDADTALAALDSYLGSIDRIVETGVDANISVKLTQLGLSFDPVLASDALVQLAERAAAAATGVTIDMEDSRFTAATVEIYEKSQPAHGNLGICLQAYLKRTPADLSRIAGLGGHIRLCKGAYVEDEDIAWQSKDRVDAAYAELLETLMKVEGVKPAIATHDSELIDLAKALSAERAAPWEFQMLYGVRPNLQKALVRDGFPVRVYVPFGSEWYPYLTRRLAERPSNTVFFLRAMVGKN